MTLTEQWKKGELPLGMYYVKMPFGVEILSDYSLYKYKLTRDVDSIEVLAPVPSYEEWQRTFHSPNLFYVQEKCLGCGERRTRLVYERKVKR